jgi:hypothetical protein
MTSIVPKTLNVLKVFHPWEEFCRGVPENVRQTYLTKHLSGKVVNYHLR